MSTPVLLWVKNTRSMLSPKPWDLVALIRRNADYWAVHMRIFIVNKSMMSIIINNRLMVALCSLKDSDLTMTIKIMRFWFHKKVFPYRAHKSWSSSRNPTYWCFHRKWMLHICPYTPPVPTYFTFFTCAHFSCGSEILVLSSRVLAGKRAFFLLGSKLYSLLWKDVPHISRILSLSVAPSFQ